MPKAFSQDEKEYIRRLLLEQGHKQFSTFGLKKTSVDELALAVGISKGAFYLFYESKEALFMDVVEQVETLFRQEVLAMLDSSTGSPRQRLFLVLKKAFTLWKTMPVLQFFTRSDYDLIFRRFPADKLQEHLSADQVFMQTLIERCCQVDIPIRLSLAEVSSLMYALFLFTLHEDDFAPGNFTATLDVLIDLVAAFWLGDVAVQPDLLKNLTSHPEDAHEPRH
jgi:AcrR family transcriptional regulator